MLKFFFSVVLLLAVLGCQAQPQFNVTVEGSKNLTPEPYQSQITEQIVELIEKYNYKKTEINDSISTIIYDNYIKTLDPNRCYFYVKDIELFEKAKKTIDNYLHEGDLSFAFYVFNVFQKRYKDAIQSSLSAVKQRFVFDSKEKFVYNREKLAWFKDSTEAKTWWRQKVCYDLLSLKTAGSDSVKCDSTLKNRYNHLITQSDKLGKEDVFQFFINSVTEAVDPHTNYFNPNNAANFNIEQSRTLEGIGATLSMENEMITVNSLVVGGPADKSKQLHIKDKIVGVAQGKTGEFTDLIGWRLDNAIQLIRGAKGSLVRLKIIPNGQELTSEPKIIEIVRDKIVLKDQLAKKKTKTITTNGKELKVGIISIPAFYINFKDYQANDPNYQSTTRDVRLLIDSLKKEKIDALVVDVRGNGGGSLKESIDLTGLFIKLGPVVQVRDMQNAVQVDMDTNPEIAWDGPLAIITDRFSASASEIFAGAIQDWGRGIIIGNQTFGKGTVQTAIDMQRLLPTLGNKSGQINLTMAKFYRISGGSTQHKGVVPDISFPMIYRADKFGESSYPSALPWDEIKPCNYMPLNNFSLVVHDLRNQHDKRMKKSIEYNLLLNDIAKIEKEEKDYSVSLNETEFKAQRDKDTEKDLENNNKRRVARGLKTLKKGENKPEGEQDFDFIEDESLKIVGDFVDGLRRK